MELNPIFLVVFFGIFHIAGGLAVGKGVRERVSDSEAGNSLIAWGFIMGGLPLVFDWLFLIREGALIAGLIGPALFVISAIVGGLAFTGELSRKNEKSFGAILMGGTGLMLGLMLTPYLIQQAQTRDDIGMVDYLCGGLIPIIFMFIGGSFVWTGLSAILKKRSFDEHVSEREMDVEEKSKNKRRQ